MGQNVSAIHGVKSDNFYQQGNAINEIWIGDLELIARLPFGDSDLGQAGWPPKNWPKIPWHQFVIPLKRDMTSFNASICLSNGTFARACRCTCDGPIAATTPHPWWFRWCFTIGLELTVIGFGFIFVLFSSNGFYHWASILGRLERLLAIQEVTGQVRTLINELGWSSLRSWSGGAAWMLHYMLSTMHVQLIIGLIGSVLGVVLLSMTLGRFVDTDGVFSAMLSLLGGAWLSAAIMFVYCVYSMRRVVIEAGEDLEDPVTLRRTTGDDPDAKPEEDQNNTD
ncbi:hypothetical protein N7492_000963 [Penicillium capsulatum]|uniref:Uncharacterized protein n=1 Tax=Penicillium capsulatum TaxID=69766 RepID=A0A9W9ISQ9_9EURO|nr:hypothetical protein N7492_000963 [Penicillium capsulatum]KAJ6129980.1 hypothetical protein N7512_002760 [Penicillium capsulatum]